MCIKYTLYLSGYRRYPGVKVGRDSQETFLKLMFSKCSQINGQSLTFTPMLLCRYTREIV